MATIGEKLAGKEAFPLNGLDACHVWLRLDALIHHMMDNVVGYDATADRALADRVKASWRWILDEGV